MRCSASFSQFRMTFFEVLYGTNIKLQRYTVLSIATKIISKVADVVRNVENVGIKIDWLDRLIERSTKKGNVMSSDSKLTR